MRTFRKFLLEQEEETFPYLNSDNENVYYTKKQIAEDLRKALLKYSSSYSLMDNKEEIEISKKIGKDSINFPLYFKELINDDIYINKITDTLIDIIEEQRDVLDTNNEYTKKSKLLGVIRKVIYYSFLVIKNNDLHDYILRNHPSYFKHLFDVSESLKKRYSHIFMGDKFGVFDDDEI